MIASSFRDMVRSLRSWRRTPGSALLVILALGLSGGALMTLGTLFNALFWRELPVADPEQLVGVSAIQRGMPDWATDGIPVSLFASLDKAQDVFQAFAGFQHVESTAVIAKTSQRLAIEGVSGRYFETLGVRPAPGQVVGAREVDHVSPVAMISFRCWQARFGADRDVIRRAAGVVLFRINAKSPDGAARAAVAALSTGIDWAGNFAVVEDGRIRIRAVADRPRKDAAEVDSIEPP